MMGEWNPNMDEARQYGKDVIILDKHEFVHRADYHTGGWRCRGHRFPVFADEDLLGWMPLPAPPAEGKE